MDWNVAVGCGALVPVGSAAEFDPQAVMAIAITVATTASIEMRGKCFMVQPVDDEDALFRGDGQWCVWVIL